MLKDRLLDHYKNIAHQTPLAHATHNSGVVNPSCGDSITMHLLVSEDKVIQEISIQPKGCVLSVATASLFAKHIHKKNSIIAQQITEKEIQDLIGIELGPLRLQCALLPLQALQKALASDSL